MNRRRRGPNRDREMTNHHPKNDDDDDGRRVRRKRGSSESGGTAVKMMRFFKLILPPVLVDKRLRFPQKFVQNFEDEIPSMVTLKVPTGDTWDMAVTKDPNKLWFSRGWESFAEFYSINVGNCLLFEYDGGSSFAVTVFDITGCEINYPFRLQESSPEPSGDNQLNHVTSDSEEGMFDSDSVDCMDDMLTDSHSESRMQQYPKRSSISSRDDVIDPDYALYLELTSSVAQSPPSSMDSEEIVGSMGHESPDVEMRESRIMQSHKTMKAMIAAQMLRIDNPHFISQMRKYNVSFLYMAHDFSIKYLRSDMRTVKLRTSNGREWQVECNFLSGIRLARGWATFWRDNKLRVGDVCVFELLSMEDSVMNVSIFR